MGENKEKTRETKRERQENPDWILFNFLGKVKGEVISIEWRADEWIENLDKGWGQLGITDVMNECDR